MAFTIKNINKNISYKQTQVNQESLTISGTVDKFIYSDVDSGFYVASFTNNSKKTTYIYDNIVYDVKKIVILGSSLLMVESIVSGQELELVGYFENGREEGSLQFKVENFLESIPTKPKAIESFLASGKISGIGLKTARKIVALFGDKTFDVFNHNINRLLELDTITEKKLIKIQSSWLKWKQSYELVIELKLYEVGDSIALKIFNQFGSESLNIIKNDPYKITEIPSIGFKTADKIAQKNGISQSDPKRIQSCVLFCLEELLEQGHTSYPLKSLLDICSELLSVEVDNVNNEIFNLVEKKLVVPVILNIDNQQISCISHYKAYGVENRIAKELNKIITFDFFNVIDEVKLNNIIEKHHLNLDESQLNALHLIMGNKVSVLTGGPGTGKTHTIKSIIKASTVLNNDIKVVLAAPTGRAAKRMFELTGIQGSTIHRLLGYKEGEFVHNEYNKLKGDLFIIDESSMIDIWLANAFLKALPLEAKVIFVGDVDQLPSVGAGNFFKDLINSKLVPVARLSKIHRQNQDSNIVLVAHSIIREKPIDLSTFSPNSDFKFINSKQEDIFENIKAVVNDLLLRGNAPNDIQILTPKRESSLGASKINENIKILFNPTATDKTLHKFSVGDRIMQTKNNRELDVFNGDMGCVLSLDFENNEITALMDDKVVIFESSNFSDLTHSYAITVHKSQGSDYPYIIIPVTNSHSFMWDVNLLYTAITRAKKNVILIGDSKVFYQATKTKKNNIRITSLPLLLDHQFSLNDKIAQITKKPF